MTKARSLADFISDGNPLADGAIAVSEVSGAAPLASPSFTGNIAVTGNVDGRDVAADGTKLDGIETSATADQTDAEIRTAVEAATDSNVFTDADHSKLNAIEASATADQTDAEIRTAVEAATDSNVFTDADHTKLNAIEASADVTDTVNVVAALTAGSNITIASDGTIAGAAQYTHPTHAGDDAAIDTGALSGATVISDLDLNITTDTLGHVTDANATVATRNLTLASLGVTASTAEVNKMDGVLATTAEINYNDITTLGVVQASKTVTADANAHIQFGDGGKILFGASSDMEIFHDGNASRIHDNGTGNLILSATDFQMNNGANNETMFTAVSGGAVTLKHSGNSKIATTSSGIDVTGTVNADALTGIGSIDATTATAIKAAGVGAGIDGTSSFTLLSPVSGYGLSQVAYSGTQFIVGALDSSGWVSRSPDGLKWTADTGPSSMDVKAVAANGNTIVCGGNTGNFTTSTNGGSSWGGPYTKGNNRQVNALTFGQGVFIAACEAASIYSSSNGTSWTERKSPTGGSDYFGVASSGSLFVAVGASGVLGTSTSGTSTWTARTSGTSNELGGVAFGNSIWVAVGNHGTIITSTNGTSWTARTSYTTKYLGDVAWTGSEFIAVGDAGVCVNSPDGINWTSYAGGNSAQQNVSVVAGEGFVVVAGVAGKVMVAPS